MTPVWLFFVRSLVLMTPIMLVWLAILYGVGRFAGAKAVLVTGSISAVLPILGSFYIEHSCDAAGPPPGQSFEGCGNVVGFYLYIFSFVVLPLISVIVLVSTRIMYRRFDRP